MNILIVTTSHDRLGNTDEKTGFWLEELAAPYYVLKDAGVHITMASPKGGRPPLDPKSKADEFQTPATRRFNEDFDAQHALASTVQLAELNADDYDAALYPGGHGPLWDLAENADSIRLINSLYAAGKPVAAVCHAPCVLLRASAPNGEPLVKDKRVTGFSNAEEDAVQLTDVVPFLLEDELQKLGGVYSKAGDWQSYAICDGHLITGQNPASSEAVAELLLSRLNHRR